MFLFQKIYVENLELLQQQVLQMIGNLVPNKDNLPTLSYNWSEQLKKNAILMKNLHRLGWHKKIKSIGISTIPPNGKLVIHTDSIGEKYSFNIPIKNCSNTYTIFYKSNSKSIEHFQCDERIDQQDQYQYHVYQLEDCNEIERIELCSPYLINVSEPHDAINPNDTLRILLLIRFSTPDLTIPQ